MNSLTNNIIFLLITILSIFIIIEFDMIKYINPTPNYLPLLVAFYSAILAFFIPFTFDIVNKVSEKYNSNFITVKFKEYINYKFFLIFLIINIVLILCLGLFEDLLVTNKKEYKGLFIDYENLNLIYRIYILTIYIFALKIFSDLYTITKRLLNYISDSKIILDLYFKDLEDI